jgi:hypothetical protein
MGFPAPPAAPPARRATPDAIAHAFGVMLARDYPDQAYDLSDAVARGVQIGLREGAQ